jgi:anti-sigma factor RsiW
MAHDRYRRLLPLLSDRALGPLRRFLVTRHVARCAACAAELEELEAMRTALRTRLPYHRAPPALAARIGAALPREPSPAVAARAARPWFRVPAWGFAGSGLAGALAGVALTVLVLGNRPDTGDALVQGVIGSHVRSLMADHLTDVQTSDQHTVKPWLSARLPVSPAVPQLGSSGFPLVGGRMDYIDGHQAAAVVYRHNKHVINLFAWATSQPDAGFRSEQEQGFNVVQWRHGGLAYYAVSDLELDELQKFAHEIADSAAAGAVDH